MASRPVRRIEHRASVPHRMNRELRWHRSCARLYAAVQGMVIPGRVTATGMGLELRKWWLLANSRTCHRRWRQRAGGEGHRCGTASCRGAGTGCHERLGEARRIGTGRSGDRCLTSLFLRKGTEMRQGRNRAQGHGTELPVRAGARRRGIRRADVKATLSAIRQCGLTPCALDTLPDGTHRWHFAPPLMNSGGDLDLELREFEARHGQR